MLHFVSVSLFACFFFFFNDTAPTEIYTLSLHDALPIWRRRHQQSARHDERVGRGDGDARRGGGRHHGRGDRRGGVVLRHARSEEHTSELQSLRHLVCRLLLEKKKKK